MVRFVKIFSPEQDHFIVESAILVVQQDVHEVGTIKLEVEAIILIQFVDICRCEGMLAVHNGQHTPFTLAQSMVVRFDIRLKANILIEQWWNLDPLHLPDVCVPPLDHTCEVPRLSDELVRRHATDGLDAAKENHHDHVVGQIQHTVFELEMRRQLSIV